MRAGWLVHRNRKHSAHREPAAAVHTGVGVHWILFGSSGYTSRPSRGVLRSYYKCLPLMHSQHTLIKTIANTR